MSDPHYSHSIENEGTIGGAVRRRGVGFGRPLALLAAAGGVGVVLYLLFSTPPEQVATNEQETEAFTPLQTPQNPSFNTPPPPPQIPTVQVPEAPPPPPPPPPVEQAAVPPMEIAPPAEQPVDCSNGNNPDHPKCIELARQQKLLERVRANAMVYDQSQGQAGGGDPAQASLQPGGDMFGGAADGADETVPGQGGPAAALGGDANRAFLQAMGSQAVEVSQAAKNNRTDAWIPQGTMIRGTLETAINSDLAGMVKATVRDDVYSFDGRRILIPAGSSLIGDYKADIQQGQERVFIVWTRMIRGDGVSIQLGSFGTDRLGRSGMTGKVDRKYWERFGPPALLTLVGGAAQYVATLGNPDRNNITIVNPDGSVTTIPQNGNQSPEEEARAIAAETIAAGIQQMASEAFGSTKDIKPTIHIDQGADVTVFVTRDLDFAELYEDPVVEEFERLKELKRAPRPRIEQPERQVFK